MITPHRLKGLYTDGKRLFTRSIAPGRRPFEERVFKDQGTEYRQIDPKKSKLAAAIAKGVSQIGVMPGDTVLYLGASHGYTPSFMSDIVGDGAEGRGFIFALDFAPRVVRDLVFVSQDRKNIAPIMADANHPEQYFHKVMQVDYVYQDIAQKNQAEIFLKNCRMFLKKEGFAFLAVKSRSVDIAKKPKAVFNEIRDMLERSKDFVIVDYRELDPLEKDHCIFMCKKK
ncbi:fibrillarin [Candidatus Woesearchaeota archaeon CG10_big_fil_rev_8_21_14_0_10_44_13]|nr:MAG: fibrillarin [Candidatus Woesearchaeota archaeon CG10_big_fil_rev_8_21_14_0_10_44_13]